MVDVTIKRFFYANGIPFNVACTPFYGKMIQAISNVTIEYKPPLAYEKFCTTLIDKEKTRLEEQTAQMN